MKRPSSLAGWLAVAALTLAASAACADQDAGAAQTLARAERGQMSIGIYWTADV